MASGKVHDASTLMMAPVVYCFWTTVLMLPVSCGVWSAVGVIFGGLYLSPDLDTPSRPYFRWGFLRWIWKPYQWAAKHRSILSHSVFLGPMLRLAILGSIMILGWAVWVKLGGVSGYEALGFDTFLGFGMMAPMPYTKMTGFTPGRFIIYYWEPGWGWSFTWC
jgi:uncharacterized metal-binding protein